MKRSLIAAAVLSTVFISAGAFAAAGDVTIRGEITAAACAPKIDHDQALITLPATPAINFVNLNAGTEYGDWISPTGTNPMTIQCFGTPKSITLTAGEFEDGSNRILSTKRTEDNMGDGVGFKLKVGNENIGEHIFQESGREISLDMLPHSIISENGGLNEYILNFQAQYVRTTAAIKTGPLESIMKVVIVNN